MGQKEGRGSSQEELDRTPNFLPVRAKLVCARIQIFLPIETPGELHLQAEVSSHPVHQLLERSPLRVTAADHLESRGPRPARPILSSCLRTMTTTAASCGSRQLVSCQCLSMHATREAKA